MKKLYDGNVDLTRVVMTLDPLVTPKLLSDTPRRDAELLLQTLTNAGIEVVVWDYRYYTHKTVMNNPRWGRHISKVYQYPYTEPRNLNDWITRQKPPFNHLRRNGIYPPAICSNMLITQHLWNYDRRMLFNQWGVHHVPAETIMEAVNGRNNDGTSRVDRILSDIQTIQNGGTPVYESYDLGICKLTDQQNYGDVLWALGVPRYEQSYAA